MTDMMTFMQKLDLVRNKLDNVHRQVAFDGNWERYNDLIDIVLTEFDRGLSHLATEAEEEVEQDVVPATED